MFEYRFFFFFEDFEIQALMGSLIISRNRI